MVEWSSPLKRFKISVGGIIIEYIADDSLMLKVFKTHHGFMVKLGKPDLSIQVHYGDLPSMYLEDKLFDVSESGGVWTLYRSKENYELTLTSPVFGPEPYRLAVFDTDFSHGDLYIRSHVVYEEVKRENGELSCCDPVEYPLDEVIFVNLLSRGRGVDLHACGVKTGDKGIIFSGVSGAGKSTIAELWKKKEVDLLSDDRIIVRRTDDHLMMYGTPWHGDAGVSLPEKAPLKAVYFLEQSEENRAVPLQAADAAFRLMVRSFPTYYSREGMEFTLGLVSEIAQEVPCYALQFTPDERAIDTVLSHVESLSK